jgi:hypothetical protein
MEQSEEILERLALAFGQVTDVTPAPEQPLHVLFQELPLPEPWTPSPARALSIWAGWPDERPCFYIDQGVVGEAGQPPRSDSLEYQLGEPWRAFSFSFPWAGDDPVRAVQLWMTRFVRERA